MARQFFVLVKDTCPHCNDGIVTKPVYNAMDARYERIEFDCEVCGGTGKSEQRVSLADALREIGIVLPQEAN